MAVHELFAYICVKNTSEAIDFYRRAFDAREKFRLTEPSGRIGHAELDFGGTTLMHNDLRDRDDEDLSGGIRQDAGSEVGSSWPSRKSPARTAARGTKTRIWRGLATPYLVTCERSARRTTARMTNPAPIVPMSTLATSV